MFRKKPKMKKLTEEDLVRIYTAQLNQAKAEFAAKEFHAENEDGSVKVIANGKRVLKSLVIAPELLSQKKENVEELIVNVVNQSLYMVREANCQLTSEVKSIFESNIKQLEKSGRLKAG